MAQITANELKTEGVAAIRRRLSHSTEALITIRGENKFVVMGIEQYQYLRECELEAALLETRAELASGKFRRETAQRHVARLTKKK